MDCEKVVRRLKEANLTFLEEKSAFGQPEIVNVIQGMKKDCMSQRDVRRFLGACTFYHILIPHYAHVAEPLYGLLKKKRRFEWTSEHIIAI
jgi:hypothetical protein